jgi:hypothetical protein
LIQNLLYDNVERAATMTPWRRPTIVETIIVAVILLSVVYFTERRFPDWQERKKMSQMISANYDNVDLQTVLQSLVNQTDGSVTFTVCDGLTKYGVSLHTQESIPLSQALKKVAAQVPGKYYAYGMLDVAVAHPVFLCEGHNGTAVTIERTASK